VFEPAVTAKTIDVQDHVCSSVTLVPICYISGSGKYYLVYWHGYAKFLGVHAHRDYYNTAFHMLM